MENIVIDESVIKFLLNNEQLIMNCFSVPKDMTPKAFFLQISNEEIMGNIDSNQSYAKMSNYKQQPLYVTKIKDCLSCNSMKLKVKKCIAMKLFDDFFGTSNIFVLTKYCSSCKITYYPGFGENYEMKVRYYEQDWKNYKIFISTHNTAFSIDFMQRSVCLKQKCHVSFIGRIEAYNMQHDYKNPSNLIMDKRRLSNAYYKFTFIEYKQRYDLPLSIKGDITEALNSEYEILYAAFQRKYSNHTCLINGCTTCLVVDGHMKAHRKICKEKGCQDDPSLNTVFCKTHSFKTERSIDDDNKQILLNKNEFHIEKIVHKRLNTQTKQWAYEVSWKGYSESTMEPKENIPRVLVEIFERYGDSTLPFRIDKYTEINGINCALIKVKDETLCIPACSLEVNEEAYLIETPLPDSCNTEKTK